MSLILSGTDGLSDVDGSAATPAIRGTDANTGIFFGADIIGFSEGGVEAARINADSQFVAAAGTAALPVITTTGDLNTGIFFPAADTVGMSTGGAERMRIDSSGNLLVGTTSTIQSGLLSSLSAGTAAGFRCSAAAGAGLVLDLSRTAATGDMVYFRTSSSTLAGYITCPTGTTTNYLSISDYRLKENVTPMTGALEKISALKPCTYTWKADGAAGQGFIAHELQAVVPDCVGGIKDAVNEDGSIKPQGIDTSFLVATLTAAIQEQQALITALTTRITALETPSTGTQA